MVTIFSIILLMNKLFEIEKLDMLQNNSLLGGELGLLHHDRSRGSRSNLICMLATSLIKCIQQCLLVLSLPEK